MDRPVIVGNRLLAALPPADFGLLAPYLQKVSLEQDAVLLRSGDRIEQVYFPHSGAIAFMFDMPNGQTVATGLIGHEGAAGILSVLGPARSSVTAVVRVAGIASRISASRFHKAFIHSGAIRHAVQTHTTALLVQFQQLAACNALHPVEARMARWLLNIHDRIDSNVIQLTQEALSQLLGVRRTTVTLVVRKLRESGAVRADRRGLIEIDRAGSKKRHANATRPCAAKSIGLFRRKQRSLALTVSRREKRPAQQDEARQESILLPGHFGGIESPALGNSAVPKSICATR